VRINIHIRGSKNFANDGHVICVETHNLIIYAFSINDDTMESMKITLVGVDLELSGKHVICVGISSLDECGHYTTKNFLMRGIKTPIDVKGNRVDDYGSEKDIPIADYRGFTKEKWDWWSDRPNLLRAQLGPCIGFDQNIYIWKEFRKYFDEIVQKAVARGAQVRVVSDNPAVDCGIIGEHLKAAHDGDWNYTLDYIQKVKGGPHEYNFVCDARTIKLQRKDPYIPINYMPVRLNGIRIIRHYAPHDALLSLCEYMGYISRYPSVVKIKKHFA
jgi:hypothetical protein